MTTAIGYWPRSSSTATLGYDYSKRVLAKALIRACTGIWLQKEGIGQGPYTCLHWNMTTTRGYWPRSLYMPALEYDYNNKGIGQGPYTCLHWNMTTTRGYWPRSLYMPALEYDYNKRVLAKVLIHGCTVVWLQQEGIGQGPYPCLHWNMTTTRGYWPRPLSMPALEYDYNKRVLAKVLIYGCTGMWLQQEGIGQGPYPCMHWNMTTTRGYWPKSSSVDALECDYNRRVLAKVLIRACTGIWLQQEGIGQSPHRWMHWNVTTTGGYWPRSLSVHALEYDYNKRVLAKVLIHACTGIWLQQEGIGQGPYTCLHWNMTTTRGYWPRSSSMAALECDYNKKVLAKVLILACTGIWLQQEGIGQSPHRWMHWNVTTTGEYWPRSLYMPALECDYNKRVLAKALIHACTGIWLQQESIGQGPHLWLHWNTTAIRGYWPRS